jgi:hypothetical protein
VELYPRSANAHDSLSEALEAAGQHGRALDVEKKGLEVLQVEQLPAATRENLKAGMEARVKRLSAR